MSEKVRITQEQENEIMLLMKAPYNNTEDELLKEHAALGGFVNLNRLKIDLPLLAKVLYGDYRVMSSYKKEDWVLLEDGCVRQIEEVNDSHVYRLKSGINVSESLIKRKASQKEIEEIKEANFFAENGREPWELKEDDILYYDDHIFAVVEDTDDIVCLYDNRNYCHIDWSTIKSKYAVACFAHDRKDVDHD